MSTPWLAAGDDHQRFITKNADDQFGPMLDKLKALGQLDDTLGIRRMKEHSLKG